VVDTLDSEPIGANNDVNEPGSADALSSDAGSPGSREAAKQVSISLFSAALNAKFSQSDAY
jgi:hypothetical protein